MLHNLKIITHQHDEMIDITDQLQAILDTQQVKQGLMIVFSMHTTAGITINENADPDVRHDLLTRLAEVVCWQHPLDLHYEGNSAAHLKTSTVGVSQLILVEEGKLVLGTWQSVYFCEFDGPRQRTCMIKIIKETGNICSEN